MTDKTKAQFINELASLRQQVAGPERLEFERGRSERVVQDAREYAMQLWTDS
jgi:hypothetical protein